VDLTTNFASSEFAKIIRRIPSRGTIAGSLIAKANTAQNDIAR
jgi:hypothetical protein